MSEYRNLSDQLSQIIASNISPKPYYEIRLVKLTNGNSVVIIKVHKGATPPYITSQGVIYQRENNESNPIKDRFMIERLNDRTKKYYKKINNFCKFDYSATKGQSENPDTYLELFLFPLPFNDYKFERYSDSDFFTKTAIRFYQGIETVFKTKDQEITLPLNLSFNSAYTSHDSLIIRPLNEDNIIYKTTTAEIFRNGNLKVLIPISVFDFANVPKHYANSAVINYILDKHSPFEEVTSHLSSPYGRKYIGRENSTHTSTQRKLTSFVSYVKMIDGVQLIYVIMIITGIYKSILKDNGFDFDKKIGFRAKVTDMWRKFIFFDSEEYLDNIKKFNIPIAPKNSIEIPRFTTGDFYALDLMEDNEFMTIAHLVLEAIGLPDISSMDFSGIIVKGLDRFEHRKGY